MCTAFLESAPTVPVWLGELSCSALGASVAAYDLAGVEVVDEVQLLVDERDAKGRSRVDVAHLDPHPIDEHVARVGLLHTADDVHERRLAGAVLAKQRGHLAGRHVEAHAAKRMHARKALLDVSDL